MENAESGSGEVFEIERVRQLIELMKEHDLSEIDLRQAEQRIRLRRGGDSPPAMIAHPAPVAASAVPQASQQPGATEAAKEPEDDKNLAFIKSPMVGTFYSKANPKSAPYVKVGDHVSPETTVCIIEAMKVFNEIQAEISGTIVAVLVDNEEPVDYGKPLFKVDTSK